MYSMMQYCTTNIPSIGYYPSFTHILIFPSDCNKTFEYKLRGFCHHESSSELKPRSSASVDLLLVSAADHGVGRGGDGQADGNRWDTSRPLPFPAGRENIITQGWWKKRSKRTGVTKMIRNPKFDKWNKPKHNFLGGDNYMSINII